MNDPDSTPTIPNSVLESYQPWPPLSYQESQPTLYFIHRLLQMLGKLKLITPFEAHWANVPLWLTARGVTTGPISYLNIHHINGQDKTINRSNNSSNNKTTHKPKTTGVFQVSVDFILHCVNFETSWEKTSQFSIASTSIAALFSTFKSHLEKLGIDIKLNPMPQEIPNAIAFDNDYQERTYDPRLAKNWWQILISTYQVLDQYHAHFKGISPPVGLMWGTLDLRDARYRNIPVDMSKAGYIERNGMDVHQIEVGFWAGSEKYEKPAFFAFVYPKPEGIEKAIMEPSEAFWSEILLGEHILDYDVVRNAPNPEKMLLNFFESAYRAAIQYANWDPELISLGKPT